jgi:hypothetical protein
MVCMFNFLEGVGKLTLVAVILNRWLASED